MHLSLKTSFADLRNFSINDYHEDGETDSVTSYFYLKFNHWKTPDKSNATKPFISLKTNEIAHLNPLTYFT